MMRESCSGLGQRILIWMAQQPVARVADAKSLCGIGREGDASEP